MQCELCGKEISSPRHVIIDGVKMVVCEACAKYGKPISPPPTQRIQKVAIRKKEKTGEEIFQSMRKVLVQDWAERIREGRIRKGLSREELGAKIGEPTVAVAKMENRDLRPSDETARKIEKVLGITLFEEIEEIHVSGSGSSRGLTLGDLIKLEKEGDEGVKD